MPAACLVAITRELALVEASGLGWGGGGNQLRPDVKPSAEKPG